ncbi:hypothetical protein SCHPADRAFT_894075 [Schizopora paradoxa]|uniref:Protein BCP1 n=1 Tax=Schizopora paradoxa TaxID=27342 RepID=A0A0H2R8M2_9AGAM|nr:hypothetical protein SCHPADRAFT_894075 [Schizopora paradoxa]
MAKRKLQKDENASDDDGNDSDVSMVNVDFDFFAPNPEVDYIAFKRLLMQLFQSDSEILAVHDLADLILSQPAIGSTVKTDGEDGDPYAFLSVVNVHAHQERPCMKAIITYMLEKSTNQPELHNLLQGLLGPEGLKSSNHVGLIVSERVMNIPVELVPPMYRSLAEEIKEAVRQNEAFIFSHYIFLTRTYQLTASQFEELQATASEPTKKKTKPTLPPTGDVPMMNDGVSTYSYHPEDACIQSHSLFTLDYPLTTQQPRDEESLGLDMGGRIMAVPAERFQELVDKMMESHPAS